MSQPNSLIDCGYLATIQAKADAIWLDPIKNIDLKADVNAAKAVLENQSVKFGELQDKNKKKVISLEWLTDCDATTEACTDDCSIDGDDATPECKEYEITCLQESSFKVADRVYRERTTNPEESIAFLIERRKKLLDEYIAQFVLTGILAAAGTNVYTGGVGTVAGALTTIAPGNWNDNIWGYMDLVARMNKFTSPYGITGTNLYQLIFNRSLEVGNADGKGNYAKMNTLKMYLDPENVEVIAPAYTFLLHKTAVAFVGKAWYPLGGANAVQLTADRMAWSENSRNLPGVSYDIFTERTCLNNDYFTAFKVQLHGLFALNPAPCSATNSGILAFACA